MANEKSNRITAAGLAKLQEELDHRIVTLRNEIAKEIDFARSYGDLSENAEYTEAKNKQSENETEIQRLQYQINHAVVVSEEELSTEKVNVGNTVTVYDEDADETIEYSIVGAAEADPFENKISDECPIGAALIGHVIDDTVIVEIPDGELKLTIKDIRR